MTFKYQPKNQNEIDKNIPSSFTQNDTSRILDRINLNRSTRLQSLKFRKIYGTFNEEDDRLILVRLLNAEFDNDIPAIFIFKER